MKTFFTLVLTLILTLNINAQNLTWQKVNTTLPSAVYAKSAAFVTDGAILITDNKQTATWDSVDVLQANSPYTNWSEVSSSTIPVYGQIKHIFNNNGNTVLIGCGVNENDPHLFLSTDNMSTWQVIENGLQFNFKVTNFTVSNSDWYLSGYLFENGAYRSLLFKSTNQGTNWTEIQTVGLDLGVFNGLAYGDGYFLAGGLNSDPSVGWELYRSSDGVTWETAGTGYNEDWVVKDIKFKNGTFYIVSNLENVSPQGAVTYDVRLYTSTNQGKNLNLINNSGLDELGKVFGISIVENTLMVFGENYEDFKGGIMFKTQIGSYTNVNTVSLENEIEIYPVPFKEILNIDLKALNDVNQLTLLDVSGKAVYKANSPSMLHQVNTTNIPAGVYFLQVQTTNALLTKKLVRN